MNTQLNKIHADQAQHQIRARAAVPGSRTATADPRDGLVMRLATPADAGSLRRLAELEGLPVPAGDVLLASALGAGPALAALPVGEGPALADPFRPTAAAVLRLREARAHLRGEERPRGRGRRIGAALGRIFSPGPTSGARSPVVPGGEGRLIR